MPLALLIFGVAFAAICIWLTVRIVNRRERWAKWTLAILVVFAASGFTPFGSNLIYVVLCRLQGIRC